jgi:hypothetical protein
MSIQHFQNLSGKRTKLVLSEPEKFTCTEKVDGSNFVFGVTGGKLWAARKTSVETFFSPDDWPNQMWAQNFRLAHRAIQQMLPEITRQHSDDFVARCELLTSVYPNTIKYSNEGSHIIIYDGPTFGPLTTDIEDVLMTSLDGIRSVTMGHRDSYTLSNLPMADISLVELVAGNQSLSKEELSSLLIEKLASRKSIYGDTRPEGWVFKHSDGWAFKVVDTGWFTRANFRNYALRRKIFRTPRYASDSIMDTYEQNVLVVGDSNARSIAVYQLLMLRTEYMNDAGTSTISSWVHERNLETFASTLMELHC